MKQQFLKGIADTFRTYVYENNRKVVPSSAAFTVYRPGGTDVLVNAQAMAVAADGLLSYGLTTADNAASGEDYRALVSYVYGAVTYYFTLFYDVVNSRLVKVITDEDLINELPQLKDNGWKARGRASSGSTTSIVDAALKKYPDDYFTGGLAYSLTKDESQEITDFVSSTGTITTVAFSSTITAGEPYVLTRSYSREIQRAFEKIEEEIKKKGKRAYLILDPYDLREAHILFSVAQVCKGLVSENNALWWELWKDYEKKAEAAFSGLNFKYDSSGDGYISGKEASRRLTTIKVRF